MPELKRDRVHAFDGLDLEIGIGEIFQIFVNDEIAISSVFSMTSFGPMCVDSSFWVDVDCLCIMRMNDHRAAAGAAGLAGRVRVKSAMKSWLLRSAVRPLEVHIKRLPSGLNTGRPSKPS